MYMNLLLKTNLTTVNYSRGRKNKIKYIVVHYTANDGDTDEGNAKYFKGVHRNASAHYFVDEDSATQVVKDSDTAWHCNDTQKYTNGGAQYKKLCNNDNSLGIELCSDKLNGKYIITKETVKNAQELVYHLMKLHNIPIENVIRHYDVSGKICPEPFVREPLKWKEFKEGIMVIAAEEKKIIQSKCGFSNPEEVWVLLDKHKYAAALYKKWADSYK